MTKRKANKSTAITPEVVAPEGTKIVSGHRLVPHAEKFAVAIEPDSDEQLSGDDDSEAVEKCAFCRQQFSSVEWDECDGYCPNEDCGRNAAGLTETPARELSEAEMVRDEIMQRNSDEHHLRVDRLVNYEVDGRTDSRAEKIFCTTLKPFGRDYLDVVRRAHGGGHYWFSMYQRRHGLVTAWYEGIEKPLVVEIPATAAPAQTVLTAPTAHPFDLIIEQANKVQDLKRALVGDEISELKKLIGTKPEAAIESPKIDNPFALFAPLMATNPSLADKLLERAFPEEEKSTWMGDLLRHPQEAMQLLSVGVQLLQQAFISRGGGPTAQVEQAPSLNQQLPPQLLAVLDVIAEDVVNFEVDADGEFSEAALRSADAVADAIVTTPQVRVLLELSPIELCRLLSGQSGLAIPGMEHLRLVGYEYIGKKKDADQFFRELKEAVANHPKMEVHVPENPHPTDQTQAAAS